MTKTERNKEGTPAENVSIHKGRINQNLDFYKQNSMKNKNFVSSSPKDPKTMNGMMKSSRDHKSNQSNQMEKIYTENTNRNNSNQTSNKEVNRGDSKKSFKQFCNPKIQKQTLKI